MDLATSVLALYGALLSTMLGILELRRDRRRVSVILQYGQFSGGYSVIITNVGHRPVTITGMFLALGRDQPFPTGELELHNGQDLFPKTLTDGQTLVVRLPRGLTAHLDSEQEVLQITVYDAEGREYKNYRKLSYNEKYGWYSPK
jgi:hypothetical protein